MAIVSFNNQALSAYGLKPLNLSWSVSGTGTTNLVELLTVGTSPVSLGSKPVKGILFNNITTTSTTFATLSVATGTTFRVNSALSGAQMAVLYTDGSSSLFFANTSIVSPAAQTITYNNTDSTYPELTRLVMLGYR